MKMGAEIPPAVIVPAVTNIQSRKRSRVPASRSFEEFTSAIIRMQPGMTAIANIRERLVSAGDTNGIAIMNINVSTTTETDTR